MTSKFRGRAGSCVDAVGEWIMWLTCNVAKGQPEHQQGRVGSPLLTSQLQPNGENSL